ncbi:MAG TPA: hypothetical protein VG826_06145 [Pirellulales bacterium]|nr:hypothetical protein [Pirellulales bacterium]
MSRRFQFSLRDLFWLVLVVAAFAGGIQFERDLRRRENDATRLAKARAATNGELLQSRTYANPVSAYFLEAPPKR